MEPILSFEQFPDIPDDFKMILDMALVDLGMIQHLQPANLLQIFWDEYAADTVVKLLLFEMEGGAVGVGEVNEDFYALFPFEIGAILLEEELIRVKSLDGVFLFGVKLRDDFLDQFPGFFDASNEAEDQTNVIW